MFCITCRIHSKFLPLHLWLTVRISLTWHQYQSRDLTPEQAAWSVVRLEKTGSVCRVMMWVWPICLQTMFNELEITPSQCRCWLLPLCRDTLHTYSLLFFIAGFETYLSSKPTLFGYFRKRSNEENLWNNYLPMPHSCRFRVVSKPVKHIHSRPLLNSSV